MNMTYGILLLYYFFVVISKITSFVWFKLELMVTPKYNENIGNTPIIHYYIINLMHYTFYDMYLQWLVIRNSVILKF